MNEQDIRNQIELKTLNGKSKNLNAVCIICDKKLEVEHSENAMVIPIIYGGVVFRSSGQYGSAVLDSIVPSGWESDVQIIICDECMMKKEAVINSIRNKRTVIECRAFANIPVEWADYDSLETLREAEESI